MEINNDDDDDCDDRRRCWLVDKVEIELAREPLAQHRTGVAKERERERESSKSVDLLALALSQFLCRTCDLTNARLTIGNFGNFRIKKIQITCSGSKPRAAAAAAAAAAWRETLCN